ncbi:hypothetical protein V0M98_28350 [Pseudomonas silesiensis]|uniref:hypothetical protein n=1 Tax=Pseudomonas silesiensis TaxID=1853130 RepID=UPI0030D0C832
MSFLDCSDLIRGKYVSWLEIGFFVPPSRSSIISVTLIISAGMAQFIIFFGHQ